MNLVKGLSFCIAGFSGIFLGLCFLVGLTAFFMEGMDVRESAIDSWLGVVMRSGTVFVPSALLAWWLDRERE